MIALFLAAALHQPALSLHLDAAEWVPNVGLRCAARWENTGPAVQGASSFGSPFDGLWLVAVDTDGNELVRQSAAHHLSPYAQDMPVTIEAGQTTAALVFPLETPLDGAIHEVRLEGGVTGSDTQATGFVTPWVAVATAGARPPAR